jgi:hypothetical protein
MADSVFIWLVLAIVIGLAAVFLVMWKAGRMGRKGPDYRAIMNLGIVFLFVGIIELAFYWEFSVFLSLGIIYFIIGFAYRNRPVKPLTRKQKRLKVIMVSLLMLAVIVAFALIAIS